MLPEYGLSFDICIYHPQMGDAIELVKQCPNVSFVLDHSGKPGIKAGLLDPWRAQMTELAALPNVWCKLSGLVSEADIQNWTPAQLQPYIDHVLSAFGVDRVMFGSDAPVLYLAGTYEKWVRTLRAATAHLSEADQQKLWRDNAIAFYRINPNSKGPLQDI
jgi:L-fuconolactonase